MPLPWTLPLLAWPALATPAAPARLDVQVECLGVAASRHALLVTDAQGVEVATAVLPVGPEGQIHLTLAPTGTPAQARVVGAACDLVAIVEGDPPGPWSVRLSTRPPPAADDAAAALLRPGGRTPQALGEVLALALAQPPGNPDEALLATVPRLDEHPGDPRIQARLPDGRSVTAIVGPACACGDVPPAQRAVATRVGDVVVISPHGGTSMAVLLPEPVESIGQVLCGCVDRALWVDEERGRQERETASKARRSR